MNKNRDKIVACSPPHCACPTLEFDSFVDDDTKIVIITDDYNGTVVMKEEEFKILAEEFLSRGIV